MEAGGLRSKRHTRVLDMGVMDFMMNYWFWGIVGLLAGGALGVRNMVKNGCPFPVAVVAATGGLYGGLLGARALYLLIYYPWIFVEDPILVIAFWESTGTWLGGPLAGLLGAALVLRLAKRTVWDNVGSFVPGLVLAHMLCRVGCIVNGCCYGSPTSLPWAVYSDALNSMVHPAALYSLLCEFIVFIILQRLWHIKTARPYLFPAYGMMLSFHRFFTEMLRGSDAAPWIIPGLRAFQTVTVFLFIISFCLFLIVAWRKRGVIASFSLCFTTVAVVLLLRFHHDAYSQFVQESKGTVLVATRTGLTDGLQPWIRQRENQGYKVVVNAWTEQPNPSDISAWIGSFTHGLSCILVAGDCSPDPNSKAPWDIPSNRLENSFGVFVSDALYGDLDGDGVPDVPVGRLPARNANQLEQLAAKSLRYERAGLGESGREVVVWAASDQFFTIAGNTVAQLQQHRELNLDIRLVGPGSSKEKAPETFLTLIKRLPIFSVIAAHGSYRSIVSGSRPVSDPQETNASGLTVEDVLSLRAPSPSGPLFLLSCDSGQFNLDIDKGPSLAEAFLQADGGPSCVIAASGIMAPETNIRFGEALLGAASDMPQTAGVLLVNVQRNMFTGMLAENTAGHHVATLSWHAGEGDEILLYNLIGDPTCRVRM